MALGALAPQAAVAVDARTAERTAVEALKAAGDGAPRTVVFRAPRLVRAGGAVHVARLRGGGRPDATGTTTGRMPVALRAPRGERAWLFYEDRAPGTLFEHGGRVVLVGERSGRPRVSPVIQGPPAVGGRLPRFLRSFAGYYAPFYRRAGAATVPAEAARSPLAAAGSPRRAAELLAAERACLVGTADTLGNFYDYAAVDHSRAAMGRLSRDLRRLAPGVVAGRYRRASGTTLAGYVRGLIDANGCREVSLYLAGGGYGAGGQTAIAIGVLTRGGGQIRRQLVTVDDLRALLRSRPSVWWNLTIDAPHAGALLDALRAEPNLAGAQTSGRAGDPSHIAGRPGARADGMLQFTRGLLAGLRATLVDDRAVTAAIADRDGKRAPTFLSALLARGFERGVDRRAFERLGVRPQSFARVNAGVGVDGRPLPVDGGASLPLPVDDGASMPLPPVATGRALTTDEDVELEVPLATDSAQAAAATFEVVSEPEHGTLGGGGATRTYTPDADYGGADALRFRVVQNGMTSNTATISIAVEPVNDAPVVTTSATETDYPENDPATAIDPGLTIDDVDSAELSGATVRVSGGYAEGDDLLEFGDQNGIGGSWNATTGVLTLSGDASLADYEAALRSVTYRNSSDAPAPGLREIAIRVDDGSDESAVTTVDVDVAGANDAPDLELLASGALAYTENDPATAVDSGATLTDPDSVTFAAATATIAAGLQPAEDRLELTAPVSGIAASYDEPTGVLTLTGPASRADFEQALRNVGYRNVSDDPGTGNRTIALQAEDSDGASTPARTRDVTIAAVNDAPLVTTTATSLAYAENDPATALDDGLTLADADSATLVGATVALTAGYVEGDDELALPGAIGIAGSWDAPSGTLTLTGAASIADYRAALRTVTYRNASDDPVAGPRTATIEVDDGSDESAAATRTIAVSAGNDAPDLTLAAGSASYAENDPATAIDSGLTLADPDSTEVASATVKIAAGLQAAEDRLELTAPAVGITASYDQPTGTLTLTGPAGLADFEAALRNVGYRNVSDDPDSAARTIEFTATDAEGATGPARTRGLTVTPANDTPVAEDDAAGSTDEATVLDVAAPGVLANDDDGDGDPLTVVSVQGQPANVGVATATAKGASVTLAADGSYSYDPSGSATLRALGEGETDTDTFAYAAGDGSASDTATVTVTVIGLPDPPEATDDSYDGVGNTTLTVGVAGPSGEPFKQLGGSVLDNDSDPDTAHGDLTVDDGTVATTLGGSVTIEADGNFSYTPPAGSTATDSFDYVVGDGERTDTGTVQIPLSGRVWYVDNQQAAGGAGRSGDPFDTLAEAVAASSTGDTLYVFRGSGTTTGMNAGTVLKANQRLLGESVDLVVGGDTLYTGIPANRPAIGNSGGTGVTLAGGSRVEGVDVSASGTAISGNGIAGSAISGVNASGASGVSLQSMTGTTTFGDVSIAATGGTGFFASSVAGLSVPAAVTANVTATGGPAVDVRSSSSPDVRFDGASSTNSGFTGFNIDAVTGGTVSAASGTLSGASNAAVDVNAGNGAVAYSGTINDGAGRPVEVTARTGGTVTISGSIAEDDTGISVSGNSGGSTTFSGSSKSISTGTGDAVLLNNNTGHSVSFTGGGLGLTTTSGRGLAATGGGTVDVQGSNNTIASTTGTALQVQNTTIGSNDLTFRSIAANGGANGIVLDSTGSSGGLAVTGSGTASSGGTIQGTVGADGTTAGVGAYLNSTRDVSLARMRFVNHQGHAIRANGVNGFALTDSVVTGTNGTTATNDEGGISLLNTTGTASIVDTAIDGGFEDNVLIDSTSGTLNLALTRITVGANSVAGGANGVLLIAEGNANMTTSVTDSDFTASREDMFQHIAQGTAVSDLTFTGNDLINGHSAKVTGGAGLLVQAAGSQGSDLTYRIADNVVRGSRSHAIMVQKATGVSNARGRITGNTIGAAGVAKSGSDEASGIAVEARGQGTHTTLISNNAIRQFAEDGIRTVAGEDGVNDNGVVAFNVTAESNLVTEPQAISGAGFRNEVADPASTVTMCLDLESNTLTGSGILGSDIRVFNDWPQTVFRLPGYGGGAQDQTAVMNYLSGRNTAATRFASVPGSGNGYTSTAACTQPPA